MFEKLQAWLSALFGEVWPYFEQGWGAFNDYAYLQAAFLAASGYLLARLSSIRIPALFRLVSQRLNIKIDDSIITLASFPLFNLVFAGGLLLAVHVSGFNPTVDFTLKAILKSTMIAVVGIFIYQLSKRLLGHAANTGKVGIIQHQTLPLFTNTVLVFVLVAVLHQIFAVWNIDMTAILASAGIAGLAIGMASKDMLSDVIAGILILTDSPYRVNDVIWVNGNRAVIGKVTRIGIRSTRLLTVDNMEVIIPNSIMGQAQIMNESSSPEPGFRIHLKITTANGVDSKHIRGLLLDIARHHHAILQKKPAAVHLLDFNGQSATFRLAFWIADSDDQFGIRNDVLEMIYQRFLQENIPLELPDKSEIAITHLPDSRQDICIKEMPSNERNLYIKEVPNLFGIGTAKILGKAKTPRETDVDQKETVA